MRMAPTRLLFSLARVQGFGRVKQATPICVSTTVSSTKQDALRKQEYFSAVPHCCSNSNSNSNSNSGGLMSSVYLRQSPLIDRHFPSGMQSRSFAAAPVKQDEINEIIEDINSKFADAREEIELAAESKETVYFNEEAETAKKAVKEVLDLFDGLLARLSESERGALQRSMGLKMEQLKAELAQLDE